MNKQAILKKINTISLVALSGAILLFFQNAFIGFIPSLASESPWIQTNWSGGSGQATWSDSSRYSADTGVDVSTTGDLSIGSSTDSNFDTGLTGWAGNSINLVDNTLKAYWKLDEASGNRIDSVGANTLTNNNNVLSSSGKTGNAANFTTNGQSLSIADNAALSTGDIDFTIAGWVNLNDKSSFKTAFGKSKSSGNNLSYRVVYNNTSDRFAFIVSADGISTSLSIQANSLGSPSTGTWYFIAAWHDSINDTINIQVNNGIVDSASYSSGTFDNTAAFMIGNEGDSHVWSGKIDSVGFWKKVLNSNDRTVLYNSGNGGEFPFHTVQQENTITYNNSSGSAKITAIDTVTFTKDINIGDTNTYSISAYAYTNGSSISDSDVELYANNSTVITDYTDMGSGWYKLTGSVVGVASAVKYGVQIKSGKTVYIDDFDIDHTDVTATLTSSVFDTEQNSDWGNLTYNATLPGDTSISLKVRSDNSADMSHAVSFSECSTISSGQNLNDGNCTVNQQRYIQYQVILNTTSYPTTPVLHDITINYSASNSDEFVYRVRGNLYYKGDRFKIAGMNIYWLGKETTEVSSKFDVEDALFTAKEMGANTVRTFSGISTGCVNCIEPELNVFNDDAFKSIDYAIQQAGIKGIRLIMPFTTNNRINMGSRYTFTDWRGLAVNKFYTDSQVKADFKAYISHIMNHVNTLTGVAYKDDPTIMAWETGNELEPPTAWTQEIANYIKSITTKQLVMDGRVGIDTNSLDYSSVDIYTRHFYPKDTLQMISDNTTVSQSNKAYIVGEYDWTILNGGNSINNLDNFLSAIETNDIDGDLFWSLFPHKDTFGYSQHGDGYTFHYPGDTTDMKTRGQQIRTHIYNMQDLSVPSHELIGAPYLHQINLVSNGYKLIWRGVPGATTYTVERTDYGQDNWQVVGSGLTDNSTPWIDTTSTLFSKYQYRLKAINLDGIEGEYSNIQTSYQDYIQNNSFEFDSYYDEVAAPLFWNLSVLGSAAAKVSKDENVVKSGNYSAKINSTVVDGTLGNVNLYQTDLQIYNGQSYTLNFWAKSDTNRSITFSLQQHNSPYTVYATSNVDINSTWQKYTLTYNSTVNDSAADLVFLIGDSIGNIWLDDISMSVTLPITTDNITSTWYNNTATITLSCDNNGGSNCNNTYYTLDGTTPSESSLEGNSFVISEEGVFTVKYYSVAVNDNKEEVKTATNQVHIDKTAPLGSVIINSNSTSTNIRDVELSINAVDSLSGIDAMIISESTDFANANFESFSTSKAFTLSYGDGIKHIYVAFKDNAGNISETYSDYIILSSELPTGSITINDNQAYTNSTNINLKLAANNLGDTGVMMISEDPNFINSTFEPFKIDKTLIISPGNGVKTIYVQFKNSIGNISSTYSDSIILDTKAPIGNITINNDAPKTISSNITLNISATDLGSIVEAMEISENPDFSNAEFEPYSTTKSYSLSSSLGEKIIYIKYKDAAGNISETFSDKILLVKLDDLIPISNDINTLITIPLATNPELSNNDNSNTNTTHLIIKFVDLDGNPLVNAIVKINALNVTKTTNDQGIIDLGDVEIKDYTIEIEYNGVNVYQVLGISKSGDIIIVQINPVGNNENESDLPKFSVSLTPFIVVSVLIVLISGSIIVYRKRK